MVASFNGFLVRLFFEVPAGVGDGSAGGLVAMSLAKLPGGGDSNGFVISSFCDACASGQFSSG